MDNVERAALLVLRGCLRAFEIALQAVAAAFGDASAREQFGPSTGSAPQGRVRTSAGTVETVDFDEDGHRVGIGSRAPVVGDE